MEWMGEFVGLLYNLRSILYGRPFACSFAGSSIEVAMRNNTKTPE